MLLNESQPSSLPSRNSSPDVVVLALTNPDTRRPGDGSHSSSPPGVPLLLPAVITVHNSDSDQSNESLEREGAGTTTIEPQLQGWNPRNTLWDEDTNDRNISDLIMVTARIPSNDGMTTTIGGATRPGLVARGRPGSASHEPTIPIPILPSTPLHPVSVSGSNTTTMGRPPHSTNPHTGTICRRPAPAEHHLRRQPGSEDNNVPRRLANASRQIRDLTHTNHSDASSWYEDRDNQPYALLIHPDEFTTYINLELLPALPT